MGRQVDDAEPPQFARRGQAVELGLARVGAEKDAGGPIVGSEEFAIVLTSSRDHGSGSNSSEPDRVAVSICPNSRWSAIARADRPGIELDIELAGSQFEPVEFAIAPEFDGHGPA